MPKGALMTVMEIKMQLLKYKRVFIIGTLMFVAVIGLAQADKIDELQEELKRKISITDYDNLKETFFALRAAEKENTELEPLINKVKEGVMKKQPAEKILKAVNERKRKIDVSENIISEAEARGLKGYNSKRIKYRLVESMERDVPESLLRETVLNSGNRLNGGYLEKVLESLGDAAGRPVRNAVSGTPGDKKNTSEKEPDGISVPPVSKKKDRIENKDAEGKTAIKEKTGKEGIKEKNNIETEIEAGKKSKKAGSLENVENNIEKIKDKAEKKADKINDKTDKMAEREIEKLHEKRDKKLKTE